MKPKNKDTNSKQDSLAFCTCNRTKSVSLLNKIIDLDTPESFSGTLDIMLECFLQSEAADDRECRTAVLWHKAALCDFLKELQNYIQTSSF